MAQLNSHHKATGARVVLHNGRFSAKNLPNYQFLFRMVGNVLNDIDMFLMRDEEEAARAMKLGAPLERVHVTGNTKFDNLKEPAALSPELGALRKQLGWAADDPVWVWGSTHDGEEEKLLPGLRQLKARFSKLRLIVAPRYVERAPRVAELLGGELRSKITKTSDVLVVDTIGELFSFYGMATLVFVGGSFVSRGGQKYSRARCPWQTSHFWPAHGKLCRQRASALGARRHPSARCRTAHAGRRRAA